MAVVEFMTKAICSHSQLIDKIHGGLTDKTNTIEM